MDGQECVMSLRRESTMTAPQQCNNIDSAINSRFKSAVLDRFPLTDYDDIALPPQICMFALPEGVTLKLECSMPTSYVVVFTSNEVFVFLHCNKCMLSHFSYTTRIFQGQRMYASVLSFYEPLSRTDIARLTGESDADSADKTVQLWVPKCLCIISRWPFLDCFREVLKHIYNLSISTERIPIERFVCNFMLEVPFPPQVSNASRC